MGKSLNDIVGLIRIGLNIKKPGLIFKEKLKKVNNDGDFNSYYTMV